MSRRSAATPRAGRLAAAGLLALGLLMLLPDTAWACPVCFDPRDENRLAFLSTAAFLTLLPLGMVAGAGLWMRKKVRESDAIEGDPIRPEGADRP